MKDKVLNIPYFSEIKDNIFDQLTGILKREYLLGYVENLIEQKKSFAFAILDIDNFKAINDSYGHKVGDELLQALTLDIVDAIKDENALVGRYGGDEFLFVYEGDCSYDGSWNFLKNIYKKALRKKYHVENVEIFITATTGAASFPNDCNDYEELFTKADKALYRGKSKGRNCYIVYVDSKHKDIVINKKDALHLVDIMDHIYTKFQSPEGTMEEKIKDALTCICDNLTMTGGFFIDNEKRYFTYSKNQTIPDGKIGDVNLEDFLNKKGIVVVNDSSLIRFNYPEIHQYCKQYTIKSFILAKVEAFGVFYGYVALTDSNLRRIWQSDDQAIVMYMAKLISLFYFYNR